jgi:predicted patatin/cPLA2 family phospholipase
MRLTRGLPNGLLDNDAIATYLARLFCQPGRTNDIRELPHKLFIVATDLDSGKSTPFGAPGLDHVPISEAVKASSALPGLYPPARIGDRDYVDGATAPRSGSLGSNAAMSAGDGGTIELRIRISRRRGGSAVSRRPIGTPPITAASL